ncbi:MAG: HAD family hydrolase [Campylobacterota bacterium]|nr:HAD family hydrolase [Campylobacterota bacterium]
MTILFDLDGTLIDSTEAILESFHNSYTHYNQPCPEDEAIKALIGYPLDVMYRELGVSEDQIWEYVKTYKEYYRKISRLKTQMLPRAVEAIELASQHFQLGIVTTKTGLYSQELLEHFNLMHHFEVLIGREHVQNPKPHAEPILKAIQILTCNREECWMIGDTRLDLGSAKNAGVNSIGVLSGYDNHEQLSTLCDIIKKDAYEAVEYLLQVR